MLIAIDGACKRNGQETCSSTGVAWIQTEDDNFLFLSKFETCSTSQRGEINGLISALNYARCEASSDEDIIIITDSEYIHNTVSLDWVHKWKANNWIGGQGVTVKNSDQWNVACSLLDELNANHERVFMQWTKGHLISYSATNIATAMKKDNTGVELYTRVVSIANRPCEHDRIVKDFIYNRVAHDKDFPPPELCLNWVIANTVADAIATYVEEIMDKTTY